jgi:hypothetical protein
MDPYIERVGIWADFQHSYTACMSAILQPALRPKFVAMLARRFVTLPDCNEKAQRLLVHIVDPDAIDRPITIIDLLSHTDRIYGIGAQADSPKRRALLEAGTNVVEIDLLRRDWRKPQHRPDGPPGAQTWHYEISVSRCSPRGLRGYTVRLQTPLPTIAIPLTHGLADASLDLQAVFDRVYDESAYPALLRYDGLPPGEMAESDQAWCDQRLRVAGFRTASTN